LAYEQREVPQKTYWEDGDLINVTNRRLETYPSRMVRMEDVTNTCHNFMGSAVDSPGNPP